VPARGLVCAPCARQRGAQAPGRARAAPSWARCVRGPGAAWGECKVGPYDDLKLWYSFGAGWSVATWSCSRERPRWRGSVGNRTAGADLRTCRPCALRGGLRPRWLQLIAALPTSAARRRSTLRLMVSMSIHERPALDTDSERTSGVLRRLSWNGRCALGNRVRGGLGFVDSGTEDSHERRPPVPW
jgi:hypothetical protein